MGKGEFLNIFMAQNAQHGYVIRKKEKKKKKNNISMTLSTKLAFVSIEAKHWWINTYSNEILPVKALPGASF